MQNRFVYLRRVGRQVAGLERRQWALVESRRAASGSRQHVVAYLGDVSEELRQGVAAAASGNPHQGGLFESVDPEWVEVDANRVRVERARSYGGSWLALELLSELGLRAFLESKMDLGWADVPWNLTAEILIVHRLLCPSSELAIAEGGFEKTALPELLGVPADLVDDNRLYRALDRLLVHKQALETHLKEKLGSLFSLNYDLLLYDMTSTFFEGQAAKNPLAHRGYSRDNRGDCKQVTIALVVSREGMPVGYEMFAGNRADVTSVEDIVEMIEDRYGKADRIWAMDRGMVSEDNIAFLKEGGRRYILGTPKSQLKAYEQQLKESDWSVIREGLEVKKCPSPDGQETFILCRSAERKLKDKAIHDRFESGIEKGLQKLKENCSKRKLKGKSVERTIGKLLGKNSRAEHLFEVVTIGRADGGTDVSWTKKEDVRAWSELSQGCYMLRSNVNDWSGEDLWKAYMQLSQAEAAFRICKNDLRLRPVWHQKEDRVRAHILVCFLAYVLWKTLDLKCRNAGLGDSARKILDEISTIQLVDVILPTKAGIDIRKTCISIPEPHLKVLLHKLNLKLPRNIELHKM